MKNCPFESVRVEGAVTLLLLPPCTTTSPSPGLLTTTEVTCKEVMMVGRPWHLVGGPQVQHGPVVVQAHQPQPPPPGLEGSSHS